MRRLLITTVATIILLWSTTPITAQASSILQTRTFRTNLVKGEYVEAEAEEIEINENPEVQESVDDGLDDVAEKIITDLAKIAEPQEPDEHTDVSAPTDIEPVIDDNTVELEEPIETDTKEPDETIEEYIGETEEEHETEVQSTQ